MHMYILTSQAKPRGKTMRTQRMGKRFHVLVHMEFISCPYAWYAKLTNNVGIMVITIL